MRTITIFFISLCIASVLHSQKLNQEMIVGGNQFLLGAINTEGLSQKPYDDWYTANFIDYTVDEPMVLDFKEELQKYQILVFLGTWCGDSKREVPRFMKILEAADFPSENLKIVALDLRKDTYKKSPDGEEWGLQILRVPTFIFYKNGREVNRIIETPNHTLEADILKIIKEKNYIPNKAKSMHFD